MHETKCKHSACHCTGKHVGKDGYCSASCREKKMQGSKCACGHPDCK